MKSTMLHLVVMVLFSTSWSDTLTLTELYQRSSNSPDVVTHTLGQRQNILEAEQLTQSNRARLGLSAAVGYSDDVFTDDDYGFNSGGVHLVVPLTGARQEDQWKSWQLLQENRVADAKKEQVDALVTTELRKAFFRYWNSQRTIALIDAYVLDKEILLDAVEQRVASGRALESDVTSLKSEFSLIKRSYIRAMSNSEEALWFINYHCNLELTSFTPRILTTAQPGVYDLLESTDTLSPYTRSIVAHYLTSYVGVSGRLDWKWETGQGNNIQLYGGIEMPLNIGALVRNRKELIALQQQQSQEQTAALAGESNKGMQLLAENLATLQDRYELQVAKVMGIEMSIKDLLLKMRFAPNLGIEDLFSLQFLYLNEVLLLWQVEEKWINSSTTQGSFDPLPDLVSIPKIISLTTVSSEALTPLFYRKELHRED